MAALETVSFFSSSRKSPSLSSPIASSSSSRLTLFISTPTPTPTPTLTPTLSLKFPISPLFHVPRKHQLCCSAVEEITVQETTKTEAEPSETPKARKKLFVTNLPWAYSVEDIKTLFGECGTVTDVEIIKLSDGKHRGYVFVTMATSEEAQAAIAKFDSYDISGRIIRVEYSKRLKKPPAFSPRETSHSLYVSNLAWKVRSNHLREFFSATSNPVSVKVVFENNSGKPAGYGFVSFATKEEAEAALSSLNGKELFERPIILKPNERDSDKSGDEVESTSEEEPVVS